MILRNRDNFKDQKPECYSLASHHLSKSTRSALLKDMPQSHRSYGSSFQGKGTKLCFLFIMEERCGSSNDSACPKTLWNSKDNNKSHWRYQASQMMLLCGSKAFFHSYICHNKLSNRIMCTCDLLVTQQALFLTVYVFCETEH